MNNDIMIDAGTKEIRYCEFCRNHEDGEMSDWDGGIGFDYIRDIHYCPICGKELKKYDQLQKL